MSQVWVRTKLPTKVDLTKQIRPNQYNSIGEIEGERISTHAKSEREPHEYFMIVGIEESVHEI